MDEKRCKSCMHFRQHYTFDERHIFRVYCGHCTFPHVRKKLPDRAACENYIPAAPDEDAFVRKEYLSKELLKYLLSLELLPPIADTIHNEGPGSSDL